VRETKQVVLAAVSRTLSPKLKDHIDDVVQETYIKTYRKLSKSPLSEIKNLENYIYTIAKDESNKVNNKESQYIKTCNELQSEPVTEPREENLIAELKDQITKLPEKYKYVLELFNAGLSLNEISEKLGLNIGTVKSKLFRGRKIIVKEMKRRCIYNGEF
jgi:RNA polymerase sigma-70 factor (ECF subfamily)